MSLSTIPSDVILHHILPFLDYDTRQTLNRLLPRHERLVNRIPLKIRIEHDAWAHRSISTNLLNRMNATKGVVKRVGVWRNYCKELLSHKLATILRYFPKFRSAIVYQLNMWSNEDALTAHGVPNWLQKRVRYLTQHVMARLENDETFIALDYRATAIVIS